MQTAQPIGRLPGFPREYRATRGWVIFLGICGSGLAVGGAIGVWLLATTSLRNLQARFWLIGLFTVLAALGFYLLLSTFRSKVVLFADRIEVDELFSTEFLSREEIRGWRTLPTSPSALVFVPMDSARRPLKVALIFRLDTEFEQWLATLPCLDIEDARSSKAEIRNDTRLGAAPGERMKKLAAGKRLARLLTIAGYVTTLWGSCILNRTSLRSCHWPHCPGSPRKL